MIGERLRLEWTAKTHPGKVREHNEDALFGNDQTCVWAVADGMGGHERGEWASAMVVEALRTVSESGDFDGQVSQAASAIHHANGVIFGEARQKSINMGTTVVACVVRDGRFAVVWAGDSRAYVLRDGVLHQLSRDHTRVQELIDRGYLTVEQSIGHPMGHMLSRAVGVGEVLELDAVADQVSAGDIFLLCSDGLYGEVSDADIARILTHTAFENAANALVEACLNQEAKDNVTVIVIRASEATRLQLSPQNWGTPQ